MSAFLEGGDVTLAASDLVLAAKLGDARAVVEALLVRKLAAARAEAEGIAVSEDEIDDARLEHFADRGLMEEEEIRAWMEQTRTPEHDLRAWLREGLLEQRLRRALVSDDAVEHRFRQTLYDHARVRVELVCLESAGMASELRLAVRENEVEWSVAAARAGGARALTLARRDVPAAIAPALFGVPVGDVAGPFETDDGRQALYRVLERIAPALDEELRDRLRDQIFDELVRRPLAAKPVRFLA